MSFPKTILGIAIGWKKRGKVSGVYVSYGIEKCSCCTVCKRRLNIGIQKGVVFLYCSRCLIRYSKPDPINPTK